MNEIPTTATGCASLYLPPGERRDEILGLIRIGLRFREQQVGKRPGILSRLVLECARRIGKPYSFAQLLDELELEAARRDLYGEQASPVEKVDRIWQLVTIHTKKGREQKPFGTVRNHLTRAKKRISGEELTLSAKP